MRVLGAILAGGQSSRFGSDKGAAVLDGKALIDHVADALRPHCDALIIAGRTWHDLETAADRPAPHLGPLGGLNAALHAAQHRGFDAVLSAGCDMLPVPVAALTLGDVIDGHWLCGLWPVALAGALDDHLATQRDRSMRHWVSVSGMRSVPSTTPLHNINTRADFALYCADQGLAA